MGFECPNCGEPLSDDDAQACPFCGSDDETGWNPDVDYYSVELPEDDFAFDQHLSKPVAPTAWAGVVLVALSIAIFLGSGWNAYGWGVAIPLLFLLLCGFVFVLGTRSHR